MVITLNLIILHDENRCTFHEKHCTFLWKAWKAQRFSYERPLQGIVTLCFLCLYKKWNHNGKISQKPTTVSNMAVFIEIINFIAAQNSSRSFSGIEYFFLLQMKTERSCSLPVLKGSSKFRHGVLQLMIHTIDPLNECKYFNHYYLLLLLYFVNTQWQTNLWTDVKSKENFQSETCAFL